MRFPRTIVVVTLATLALGNLSVTFLRSTIPLAIHGTVSAHETRPQSHPGVDDVHLVTIGGRRLHIDADVAGHLQIGDLVEKRAWSRTLHTSRGTIRVDPSADVWGMAITMPFISALALILLTDRGTGGVRTSGKSQASDEPGGCRRRAGGGESGAR